jgi:hypothetical protein
LPKNFLQTQLVQTRLAADQKICKMAKDGNDDANKESDFGSRVSLEYNALKPVDLDVFKG